MEKTLRIHREAIQETIRQLRAWSARWEETRSQAQRAAQALVDAAQAAPARFFEAATARALLQLQQDGERIQRLAGILEEALQRLEEAFHQAAQIMRGEWIAPPLPTTPLAVGASGRPIPNQFVLQFPTPQGPIPWATACGPAALSMALSRLTRHPIPAQEVANRLVEITGKAPEIEGGRATALTTTRDLISTANAYGIHGERVYLMGRSSEEAWQELQGLVRQPVAVMALVTAKSATTSSTRDNADWESYGLKAPEIIVSEEDRRKGDGGILTGSNGKYKNGKDKPGEIAHWVVIDRLEERDGKRYVVVNNPYHNRQERYSWEHFWESMNHQARGKDRWWVLKLETRPPVPEGNAVASSP
ncbi:hypothetical protein HRbin22_00005 [Candidatus Thermoflexus japonica]|uniref:Uncharacterized protein n=1 Tax=Candidatus Thermoflexus japonica TaxID=2035417 RepID=A0A2H5Y2V7_9CHLR|nr:hypothetical protein HRbin22_00005 [Candidatus Thermoflexus japonica]